MATPGRSTSARSRTPPLAALIGARFETSGREVAEMIERLLDVARGHPQRAMLLAHHLWEQTPPGGTADAAAWSAALASVSGELEEAFERAWRSFSQGQQRVLAAIAWGQEP